MFWQRLTFIAKFQSLPMQISQFWGHFENRLEKNEKNRIASNKCHICTLDIPIDFHWKNEANRWGSEICLIRSYADSLLSAFLREFVRVRVEWCNIMPTTVMFVTCGLKRRNGTRTERNIFNGAFNDIWDAIFAFICKLEYIQIWPCSAITKFSISERY